MLSEDTSRQQGFSHSRRPADVRQVQVAEALYEDMHRYADLSVGRLQSVATQVLPAY